MQIVFSLYDPRHDKINKMAVRPTKFQISLGTCMKKAWVLSYPLSAQRRLWSDWADAQADQNLRWAHSLSVGLVMSRLMCISNSFSCPFRLMTLLLTLQKRKHAKAQLRMEPRFFGILCGLSATKLPGHTAVL